MSPFKRIPWPEPTFEAVCDRYRHAAPGAGCQCGIYAVDSPLEIRWQTRMMSRMLGSGVGSSTQPFLVIGRVELAAPVLPLYESDEANAVSERSQHFPVLLGDNAMSRPVRCVEVRAAAARITELFVYDGGVERVWLADEVAEMLAQAYRASVVIGEPRYSGRDWREKLLPEHRYLQVGLVAPRMSAEESRAGTSREFAVLDAQSSSAASRLRDTVGPRLAPCDDQELP